MPNIGPGYLGQSPYMDPNLLKRLMSGGGSSAVAQPQAPGEPVVINPGYTPDYASLIANSPIMLQALAQNEQMLKQAKAARIESLRQLTIRYGGLPSGFKDKYHDINDETLKLAAQNEQSDVKRLNRQYDQNIFANKRVLAARGALGSGDLADMLNKANMAKESSLYDASNAFGDAAKQAIQGYLSNEQSAAAAKQAAAIAAAQAVYANPAYAPVPPTYGPPTPTSAPGPSGPFNPILNKKVRGGWF